MIQETWAIALTTVFVVTGAYCTVHLVRHRRSTAHDGLSNSDTIDINHLIMSVAMIAMVWWAAPSALVWAQVALFAVLGIGLLVPGDAARTAPARVSAGAHAAMNGAMVWMLAAMPLLMAERSGSDDGGPVHDHAHDHGGGAAAAITATPVWADVVNAGLIAVVAVCGVWWAARVLRASGHRLHDACNALMAGGMAAMLAVMN